jgi:molecular chaperone DnaK (HSP70)
MLLGIDFGTTRTVVAAADRGNYPVISFHTEAGDSQEWYPSLIASRGDQLAFGLDAAERQAQQGWVVLRSFKRTLSSHGPGSTIHVGNRTVTTGYALGAFLATLRHDLVHRSNLGARPGEDLEATISVPANANSNQRFNTIEAFKQAGFVVRGMINEPSAAGIEYAHRYLNSSATGRKHFVVVYDLGGGTFDASLIGIGSRSHEVIASEGIAKLGGDDFDEVLLELALGRTRAGQPAEALRPRLLEECREKKEGIHPNTRKLAIDLGRAVEAAGEVVISTAEFYERCHPMVERTIEAVERLFEGGTSGEIPAGQSWDAVASIYLVGGSSDLPVVARTMRERYGRLVRRSPYPHAATAIGLAIAGDKQAGYRLREGFTRHFGVWREAEEGRSVAFDVLFAKDTPLPENGRSVLSCFRRYRPAHNIGHFRYMECGRVSQQGDPAGDITPWDEISFPFDPSLQSSASASETTVDHASVQDEDIEERYTCDSSGIIRVEIIDHTTGYHRAFLLHQAAGTP